MNSLPAATALATVNPTASILNKPRWTLPGSFNDPLACIFFCGFFSFIKDNSLHSWSIKRSSFLLIYFHPYQSSFFFDLCITIATKDVFLLQVSTLRTNIYVPLHFYELAGMPPPAAVHLDGAPLLGRRHPQDALQQARRLGTALTGIIYPSWNKSRTLHSYYWSCRRKKKRGVIVPLCTGAASP